MSAEKFLESAGTFFLVFIRMASLLAVAPIFGHRVVPVRLRILFALALAGTSLSFIRAPAVAANSVWHVAAAAASEALIGLLLGFAAGFVFYAVQFAGDIMSYQAGFTLSSSIDPSTLEPVTIFARLQMLLAVLLYVLLDGHHFLLQALATSFERVPLATAHFGAGLTEQFVSMAGTSIAAAVQISAPVLVATSLAHLALAILSRTMPQLNIFAMSFPVVIAIGLMVVATTLPAFARLFQEIMESAQREVMTVLQLLGA